MAKRQPTTADLLNPDWMAAMLDRKGIDSLIEAYSASSDPEMQIIQAALDLSRHTLRAHPESLREQLQARLVSQTEPALAPFQSFPEDHLLIRSEWPAFQRPGGPLLRTLPGHDDAINWVAVSPDERFAVSASDDKTLKVWDISRGLLLTTLKGHTNSVISAVVTHDGKQIISGALDDTIQVWDVKCGKLLKNLKCKLKQTLRQHSDCVISLALTPDGKRFISGSDDQTILIWDLKRKTVLQQLEGHDGSINRLAVTPDSKQLVSASDDETLKI